MPLFSLVELEQAMELVHRHVPPTPAHAWPLLEIEVGATVVVKHENHTPTGSFKARGGLIYVESLMGSARAPAGLVTATRGNHGQSIALAGRRHGLETVIVVPAGNSPEKNRAMEAQGGTMIVSGADFDESRAEAARIADERGYHLVPPFHPDLIKGAATYALEWFSQCQPMEVIFAPIGMGSGLCGLITARDLLNLNTEIIGVVAARAPAFALSFEAKRPVQTPSARTFADGMACRKPEPLALELIARGATDILRVEEEEIAQAIRLYYDATHNLAEGAGAAALAALVKEKHRHAGRRVGVVLSGGNIDRPLMAAILQGGTPGI